MGRRGRFFSTAACSVLSGEGEKKRERQLGEREREITVVSASPNLGHRASGGNTPGSFSPRSHSGPVLLLGISLSRSLSHSLSLVLSVAYILGHSFFYHSLILSLSLTPGRLFSISLNPLSPTVYPWLCRSFPLSLSISTSDMLSLWLSPFSAFLSFLPLHFITINKAV